MPRNSEEFEHGVQTHIENILAKLEDITDPSDQSQERVHRAGRALTKVVLGPLTQQMGDMEAEARHRLAPLFITINDFKPEAVHD